MQLSETISILQHHQRVLTKIWYEHWSLKEPYSLSMEEGQPEITSNTVKDVWQ
jgi:hypothetical protein